MESRMTISILTQASRAVVRAAMLALLVCSPLATHAGPVNVNAADAATLARELVGIGPSKAQAIVAHREKHGAFRSAEDLARVKGIGAKTVERNRELLRFDGRPAAATPAARTTPAPGAATKTVPRRTN
jgi:competence protein ComEA